MANAIVARIEELGGWTDRLSLKRHDFLIRPGTVEKNIYYVEEGTLRVIMEDKGEEHTIRFGYKGTLFTALDSFISGKPTVYGIQAIKKSELLVMKKKDFLDIIAEDKALADVYRIQMEQLVLQQMERETDLLTASPQDRYDRVMKRSPHLFQEIPSKYIASYLRMTPETLSRLKKS